LIDDQKRVHFDLNTSSSNLDQIKSELRQRDEIINSLQHELKLIKNQQDALINGNSQIYDKDTELRKLKNELLDYKAKFDLLNDDVT
jgi:hypothetical protein